MGRIRKSPEEVSRIRRAQIKTYWDSLPLAERKRRNKEIAKKVPPEIRQANGRAAAAKRWKKALLDSI